MPWGELRAWIDELGRRREEEAAARRRAEDEARIAGERERFYREHGVRRR